MTEQEPVALPPTATTDAGVARRTLQFLSNAEAALDNFEVELQRGWTKVSFSNAEKALTHAREQEDYIDLAVTTSQCGLWVFLPIDRTELLLEQFVSQGRTSKFLLNRILHMQREKVEHLSAACRQALQRDQNG